MSGSLDYSDVLCKYTCYIQNFCNLVKNDLFFAF